MEIKLNYAENRASGLFRSFGSLIDSVGGGDPEAEEGGGKKGIFECDSLGFLLRTRYRRYPGGFRWLCFVVYNP